MAKWVSMVLNARNRAARLTTLAVDLPIFVFF